jgi:hypothetical protein
VSWRTSPFVVVEEQLGSDPEDLTAKFVGGFDDSNKFIKERTAKPFSHDKSSL